MGKSQTVDSTEIIQVDTISEDEAPTFGSLFKGPPGRAMLYSAILPGAGQAYNRKYWKTGLVYAAIGVNVYILLDNLSEFNRFDDAFRERVDMGEDSMDEFQGVLSLERINNFRQVWRKNVQRAYIGLGLIYIIQMTEAFVDRHLMDFDISDDLSLELNWKLSGSGIGVVANLKSPTAPKPVYFF